MMADCSLFDEDEVCISTADRGIIYGLVVENSEYVSSDDYSDGEDVLGRVKRGTVRVSWHPEGKEDVVPEKDLCLADRSLMPGDVVRRLIEGKDSQRGYVIDINSWSHIKIIGTDKYIYKVNTRDLEPLQAIDHEPGDVTLDSWVGKIDSIHKTVTVRFADDARCELEDYHLNSFDDLLDKNRMNSELVMGDYFPGQALRGKMYELVSAKWTHPSNIYNARICSRKPHKSITVCVEDVKISSVEVHWVCKGFSKVENPLEKFEPPPECITGERLDRLQPLDSHHCSIQLGDRCYYIIKEHDRLDSEHPSEFSPLHVDDILKLKSTTESKKPAVEIKTNAEKKISGDIIVQMPNGIPPKPKEETDAKNCLIEKTESMVGENGDQSTDKTDIPAEANGILTNPDEEPDETMDDADDESDELDSCSSNDSNHSAISQPAPRRKNLKKKSVAQISSFKKQKRGNRPKKEIQLPVISCNAGNKVAVDVCCTYSSASVMWQDGTIEQEVPSVDLFPIHHLDELEFFPGDYVVDSKETGDTTEYGVVVTCDHAERTCFIKHMKAYDVGKTTRPLEMKAACEVSVYDIKDHPYYKFRPGQVVIRVGGFENSAVSLEATGLVQETSPEGYITVRWADQSISPSYPQELYIVGGDMSETSSDSEWSTESDSEAEVGGTDESWETEDEEVIKDMDADDFKNLANMEDAKETNMKLLLTLEKQTELGTLLERAHEALNRSGQTLDGLSKSEESKLTGVVSIYLDVLKICKHFDKIWKTTYFEDPTLKTLISDLKREIRKGKSVKIVRHLTQLYASWKGEQESCKSEPIPMESGGDMPSGEEKSTSCTETVTSHVNNIDQPPNVGGDNTSCSQGKCQGACNCPSILPEAPTLNELDSNVIFSRAWTLCHTIGALLEDNIKQMQQQMIKYATGKNDMQVQKSNTSTDVPETNSIPINETEVQPVTNTDPQKDNIVEVQPVTSTDPQKDNIVKEKTKQKAQNYDHNGDIIVNENENVEISEQKTENKEHASASTTTTMVSSDNNKCASEGVIETMDNIIQKYVSNLPCLPDSCLSPNTEESNVLSRYEEVEDIQPHPESEEKSETKGFHVLESAPSSHQFKFKTHCPSNSKSFMSAVRKELSLLQSSLPDGIFVKAFEDRMDLFSIMIMGPSKTPYEDGLFFFDVQLPNDYPKSPPVFHYISYCEDRLNPNLYEDGKVCVSLLGTWSGKGNEVWTNKSNMLQVLLSIQGLILVNEPYYNEAGFEKQRGSQQGHENSKMYNEMAALKLTQSMPGIANRPPAVFQTETQRHISSTGHRLICRLESWVEQSNRQRKSQENKQDTFVGGSNSSSSTTEGGASNSSSSTTEGEASNSSPSTTERGASNSSSSTTERATQEDNSPHDANEQPTSETVDENSPKDDTVIVKSDTKITSPDCSSDRVTAPVEEEVKSHHSEPEFPLLPASKGFCMTIIKHIENFRTVLNNIKQS